MHKKNAQQSGSNAPQPGNDDPQDTNTPDPQPGDNGQQQGDGANGEFTPITSQEELDRIIAVRLARQRRQTEKDLAESRFADYDQLKADSEELQSLKGTQQTDIQQLEKRVDALVKERDDAIAAAEAQRIATARTAYAEQHGVSAKLLHGDDESAWEDQVDAIKQELGQHRGYAPRTGQGNGNNSPMSGGAERAAQYLAKNYPNN